MSSWKNANKSAQKTHRERHQPEARKHLGVLEKKKDYKLRAEDYNSKKAQLQYLHKKALDRNPDEFYYHMINSQVKDGVHKDKDKEVTLTPEQVQLMQTQDYRYISNKRTMEKRKIEKLQSSLHLLDDSTPNKHTFFVDDKKEIKKFNFAKRLNTPAPLLKRRYNRLTHDDLKNFDLDRVKAPETLANVSSLRHRSYKELAKRAEREKKLMVMQKKMEIKKALQDKSKVVKERLVPETPDAAPVYVWKQERKK